MISITNTNGNGKSKEPNIETQYEPLQSDQVEEDRWLAEDEFGYRIAYSDEVEEDLGIEDDDQPNGKSDD